MNRRSKAGFTLVELMVVAIIVAILAAVAIPLFSGNRKRAIATEAQAGLGSVRTAIRVYQAEHASVPLTSGYVSVTNSLSTQMSDLDGKYFSGTNYTYTADGTNNYTIRCAGTVGDAAGITVTLDQGGNWSGVP